MAGNTLTISTGQGGPRVNTEFNLIHALIGLAAIGGAYYVAEKFDLVQRAEAVIYGFPVTRAEAIQDVKILNNLLSYAQQVGDTGLENLVRGRLSVISQRFPQAVVAAQAATGSVSSSGATSQGPPTTNATIAEAVQATGVPIPKNATEAHNAIIALDTFWFAVHNLNPNLANLAHLEANYIRRLFPHASPPGGYTQSQLLSMIRAS